MSARVTPASREELAEVLRRATADRTPVRVVGAGGASRRGRVVPDEGVTIHTAGLGRILDHQPADLTVTVEAGTPVAALQAALAERGQCWAQAGDRPGTTVGGTLATADSGHRRLRFGAVRDSLLQVVVVTGDGRTVTGGGKTVKGVAGYDIPRLTVGAHGTLGVIAEVTLKLWPTPPSAAWFHAHGTMADLGTRGAALLREHHLPGAVLLRPDGLWMEIIGPPGDLVPPAGMRASAAPVHDRFDAHMLVGVPPTAVAATAVALEAAGMPFTAEMGVGTVRVGIVRPADVGVVRDIATRVGGHAVVADAPPEMREDPWGPPPPGLVIMRRLRAAFDPAGILNRGMFPAPPVASSP